MLLLALSIRLNEASKGVELAAGEERSTMVAVTYDELQRMTGFARASVSTGLSLLEALGAIRTVKRGRKNFYELVGVNKGGQWCQIPKGKLLQGDGALSVKPMERKRSTLNALKISVVLATLRRQATNMTLISYAGLMKWTGIRRSEIGPAIQILIAWGLVNMTSFRDEDAQSSQERRNIYRLEGLVSSPTSGDDAADAARPTAADFAPHL